LNLLDFVEQKSELESNLKNPQQQSFILPTYNRFFEVSINKVNESKGIYTRSLVFFRDITDGKVAKEKLEKQTHQLEKFNLLKDKLFSIIAHDLKAPFASLLSMLRIVGDEGLTA
jgi:signal transduction histidine kinase